MWEDPIVAEVHRTREKLAAEHNFDIAAFFADIRKRQTALGSRLVSRARSAGATKAVDRKRPENGSLSNTLPRALPGN